MKYLFIVCCLICFITVSCERFSGHMQSLGSHQTPEGEIITVEDIDPQTFYANYVAQNKPVFIKSPSMLSKANLLHAWSDSYLKNAFGNEIVNVEMQKYENRFGNNKEVTLKHFVDTYNESSKMYLISTLPMPMRKDFPVPSCLNCNGFFKRMQDFVLWFSSGNTNSHLHYDNVENLYCQVDGIKEWFMVDPYNGSKHIIEDHPEGQYTSVNVLAVDMNTYPGMLTIPWWKVTTVPGSCLYVPCNWWHQVRSENSRNMAVNIWWAPMLEELASDFICTETLKQLYLSDLNFTRGEWIKWILAKFVISNGGSVSFEKMFESVVHEHTSEHIITKKGFSVLDINGNGLVELSELVKLEPNKVHEAVQFAEIGALNVNGKSVKDAFKSDEAGKDEL